MIEKLYDFFKKYKVAIISALTIILIGVVILLIFIYFYGKSSLNTIEEKNYAFEYDGSWKVDKKTESLITMKHKSSGSLLKIELVTLDSENKYFSIDDLIDEVIYNIEKQNTNYKLLSKQEEIFTKYQFNGYKMLYETDTSQTMVSTFKKSDKLIIISYEAKNDYFDILLDSVHSIIYSFDIKEEKFDLTNSIKLNTTDIEYSDEKQIDELLNETKKYEIANNNYYVSYSIPSNFQLNSFNTNYNYFDFKDLKNGSIKMTVSIKNINIYEYFDKDDTLNLYSRYKSYKEYKDNSDFKESITKLDSDYDSYVYKNSYYYDKAITYDKDFKTKEYKKKYENIELIFALNENHILVIEISSSDLGIPEKLVNMIKINDSSNYSSYIKINKQEGFLISELKRFVDYDKKQFDSITIKIPEKYEEYEKNNNLYEERRYGLNHNEEHDTYDYEVKYQLTSNIIKDIDGQVKIIGDFSFHSPSGEYKNLTLSGEININNKNFHVYDGGYTNLGGIPFTNINRFQYYIHKKVLFYKMETGGYLIIEVSGNGKKITQEIINEVTNFTIEKKDY